MADATGTEGQGTPAVDPNAAQGQGQVLGQGQEPTGGEPTGKPRKQSFTAEEMAEVNAEAAKRRHELRAKEQENQQLKEQLKKIEEARLAEEGKWKELAERAQAENLTLRKEMHEKFLRAELRNYALAEGLIDPDIANLITLPAEGADFQALVKAHKEAKPHLYKSTSAPPPEPKKPVGTPPATPAPAQGASGEPVDLSKLSKADYKAYKARLLASLRNRA